MKDILTAETQLLCLIEKSCRAKGNNIRAANHKGRLKHVPRDASHAQRSGNVIKSMKCAAVTTGRGLSFVLSLYIVGQIRSVVYTQDLT